MPLEETYILEGLLQGPLPGRADAAAALQSLAGQGIDRKVPLSLQIDGGQFSMLADEQEHDSRDFQPLTMSAAIQKSLEAVLNLLTPPERMQVFSTLRSREFRMGCELQTLYQIVPPGIVSVQTREVAAEVKARPKPWSRKEKLIFGVGAAGIMGLVIAVSTFFVDYRALFGRTLTNIRGTNLGELKVDAAALEGYVKVEATGLNMGKDTLTLSLSRGPKWDEAIRASPAASADWPAALAVTAVQKRYAMVFLKNADGVIIRSSVLPLDGLFAEASATFSLAFGKGEVLQSVVVRP